MLDPPVRHFIARESRTCSTEEVSALGRVTCEERAAVDRSALVAKARRRPAAHARRLDTSLFSTPLVASYTFVALGLTTTPTNLILSNPGPTRLMTEGHECCTT